MVDLEDESKASMAKIALRIWKGADTAGSVITLALGAWRLALGDCAQAILEFLNIEDRVAGELIDA